MAHTQTYHQPAASITAPTEGSELGALLEKQFKPKTDEAAEAVKAMVAEAHRAAGLPEEIDVT